MTRTRSPAMDIESQPASSDERTRAHAMRAETLSGLRKDMRPRDAGTNCLAHTLWNSTGSRPHVT